MTAQDSQQNKKQASVSAKAIADNFTANECFEFRMLREMRLVEFRNR